jgi:mono/diheme cytochrome c family protein
MKRTVICAFVAALTFCLSAPAAFADSQAGAALFKAKCAMCHGADGKGDTAMGKNLKLKDFSSDDVQNVHDSEIKTLIENGKGKMPAFKGKLTDKQLGDVIQFVRTLKKK